MTKEEKNKIIGELAEKFKESNFFYITDAAGLTVEQVNAFRKMCYEKQVEYKVVKNTLIKKALEASNFSDTASFDEKVLKGFSGILFSKNSGNAPAKVIKEFRVKNKVEKPLLKGASIDSDLFIGNDQLEALVALKSKNELIGDIIGLLQSPAKTVLGALQSGQNKLAGVVKTLSDRKE